MTPSRDRRPGRRLNWHIVLFMAPALVVYSLFVVLPLVASVRLSLFSIAPSGAESLVGLDNFLTLFGDPVWSGPFLRAVLQTGEFFMIHMLVQNTIGLLLAVLLTGRNLRGRAVMRGVIFAPAVISIVVVGFIWQLLLNPIWGVAPKVLGLVGLSGLYEPWLGQEGPALVVVGLISSWQYIGLPMLLFSAALLTIPEEVLDAAHVDGAGGIRTFVGIQLPLILPTIGIVAILTFVGNVRAFDLVYTLQGSIAGPNYSTDLLGTFFYRAFFGVYQSPPNPAMGATIASVILAFVAVVVCLYLWGVQRRLRQAGS